MLQSIMTTLGSSVSLLYMFFFITLYRPADTKVQYPSDDTWKDLSDKYGNKLHVGKLEFKTKHGRKLTRLISMYIQGM